MSGRSPGRAPDYGVPQSAPPDPLPDYVARGALQGRRALVAGGIGEGHGRAVAVALAKEGAAVAVADSTGRTGLPPGARPLTGHAGDDPVVATGRLLAELGACSLAVHCDLTNEGDCQGAVAYTALEFGAIDTLAICGGAGSVADGLLDIDRMERTLRATLHSALWLVQAARIFMAEEASVILMGPGAGRSGPPDRLDAAVRAAGATDLIRSLAEALQGRGGRVNCVVPERFDSLGDIASAYVDLAGRSGRRRAGGALTAAETLRADLKGRRDTRGERAQNRTFGGGNPLGNCASGRFPP